MDFVAALVQQLTGQVCVHQVFTFHAQLHKVPACFWSLLGPQLYVNVTC